MKLKNLSTLALLGAGLIIGNSALAQWTRVATKTWLTNAGDSLGIGTTNPTCKVDIQSTGIATMSLKSTTSNANILFDRKTAANNATLTYRTNGVNNWQTGTLGNNNYVLKNNSLNSVAIYCDYLTNNVGIGSAAPTNKLSVTGNANFTGNVGIGIATPQARLHTSGTVRHEGLAGNGNRKVKVDAAGNLFAENDLTLAASTNVAKDSDIVLAPYNGTYIYYTQSVTLSGLPTSISSSSISVQVHQGGVQIILLVAPNGDTLCLFNGIDRGQALNNAVFTDYAAGTFPYSPTVAVGPFKPDGGFGGVASFGSIGGGTIDPNGTWSLVVANNSSLGSGLFDWSIRIQPGINNYLPKWNEGSLMAKSNVFDDGTNVGIGTASPSAKLQIQGNIKIADGTQGAGKVLTSDADGLASWATSLWSGSGNNIWTNNSGSVTIGSATPGTNAKLNILSPGIGGVSVLSGSASQNSWISVGRTTDEAQIGICKGGDFFSNSVASDMAIKNFGNTPGKILFGASFNSAAAMAILPNGNVGIGTIAPGGQFQLSLDQGRKPSTSTWTITSDARLKNIDDTYSKGLTEIMQLNPITYHYKNVGDKKFDPKTLATQAVGFTAQEVQNVFPEAVGTDEDGYLNLNIHSILIASVNAIKELNTKLEAMKAENADLKSCIETLCNSSSVSNGEARASQVADEDALFQNQPNPANTTTVIRYALVKNSSHAEIIIRDLNGSIIKSFALAQSGKGQVTVNAHELAAGTYTYTLVVNTNTVDTKLMVITK